MFSNRKRRLGTDSQPSRLVITHKVDISYQSRAYRGANSVTHGTSVSRPVSQQSSYNGGDQSDIRKMQGGTTLRARHVHYRRVSDGRGDGGRDAGA